MPVLDDQAAIHCNEYMPSIIQNFTTHFCYLIATFQVSVGCQTEATPLPWGIAIC